VSVSGSATRFPKPEYSVSVDFGSAPQRADSLFATVLAVIDSVKAGTIKESDVEKIKEQQQRTLEVSSKQNSYWLGNIAARVENEEDPRGLLAYQDFINGLTAAQLKAAAVRFLDTNNYARFILLPVEIKP